MTTDIGAAALDMPKPPPQIISRLTGYPTWRTPYPGWDAQQLDAITFMSVAGIFFAVLLAVKYRQAPQRPLTLATTTANPSELLTICITYYLYATLVTVFGFWLLDVGKVWVVLGVLHNAMELCVLMTMAWAKKREGFAWFWGSLFVYWAATQAICVMVPWPLDGVYFKFQGLILDFALCINFYRLMQANSPSNPIALTDEDDDEPAETLPNASILVTHVAGKGATYAAVTAGSSSTIARDASPAPIKLAPNTSIWLLLLAAVIHTAGNCITVVSLSKYPFLIFQFCYGITFPLYGFYVARQPGASKMRWFTATRKSETLVTVASTILSGAFSAVGIKVVLDYYGS